MNKKSVKKRMSYKKKKIGNFFKAWQPEFPNFATPKLKKMYQKKDRVVSVSAGQGAYDPFPVYDATSFKYIEGHLGGGLGQPKVRGFKRTGGKRFKDEVKARAYAKKLLGGY